MKKIYISIAIAACISVLVACHKKGYPTATKDAAPAVVYTQAQLVEGQKLYNDNCGKCHELHEASEFTIHKWGKILPEMTEKAELQKDKSDLLTAWVNTNAKK